jgi:hypothetical protein
MGDRHYFTPMSLRDRDTYRKARYLRREIVVTTIIETVADGQQAIDDIVKAFNELDTVHESDIALANKAIETNIQLRDYALGLLGLELSSRSAINLLTTLLEYKEGVALTTLRATYKYEAGEDYQADLNRAFELDETYSLANLIKRVTMAGWPKESFAQMRQELHPKVEEWLEENLDKPLDFEER